MTDSKSSEAIVLCTRDHGESDRIVTFLARTAGKMTGIAKGARRSRKRFPHAFEQGSTVEVTYRDGRSLVFIESCKLVEPNLELRSDIERWGYASLVNELLLELTSEGESSSGLYMLAREALGHLAKDKDLQNVVLLFMLRLMAHMGYLPELDRCGVCGRQVSAGTRWMWAVGRGPLTCPEHAPPRGNVVGLDFGTLILIREMWKLPVEKIWRLRVLKATRRPLLNALLDWARSHTRRDLKSLRVLEQLLSAEGGNLSSG